MQLPRIKPYLFLLLIGLCCCNTKIKTTINAQRPPLDHNDYVYVLRSTDKVPADADKIGILEIKQSKKEDLSAVIKKAKSIARKAGANIIHIVQKKTNAKNDGVTVSLFYDGKYSPDLETPQNRDQNLLYKEKELSIEMN